MSEALHRLGPIYLAPGINRLNAGTFMLVAFVTIGFLTFVNFGQAYVLNEILLIPREEQGNLTGRLAFLTEVVTVVLVGGFGVLSDRDWSAPYTDRRLTVHGSVLCTLPIGHERH